MSYQRQVKAALGVFLVFTLVFAVNLFHLQPVAGGRAGFSGVNGRPGLETAAIGREGASGPEQGAGAASPGSRASASTTPPSTLARAVERELRIRRYLDAQSADDADLVLQAAILAFEWDNGLPLTATPSEALLQGLILGAPPGGAPGNSAVPPTTAAEGLIRTVQQSLSLLGYTTLKPDGRIGPGTQKVIRSFEVRQGMAQTGRISAALVRRVFELAGKGNLADRR